MCRFRILCRWLVDQKWFDNVVLLFIGLNCITLAMERPNIPPDSRERLFLSTANYIFTGVFAIEMFIKVMYPLDVDRLILQIFVIVMYVGRVR